MSNEIDANAKPEQQYCADGKLAFWMRETADQIDAMSVDAARYRWLRDGNGYAPEEGFARGGAYLDRLCDEGIRDAKERT